MRLRRFLGLFGLALLFAATGAVLLVVPRGPTYAALHQVRVEEVPGTLLLELVPPPEGFRPRLSPEEAYDIAWAQKPASGVERTLAIVRDRYFGADSSPDWVFIARNECYPAAKGDLVSPARSGSVDEACTEEHLALVSVDAHDGLPAASYLGVDIGADWVPAIAGGPEASFVP